LVAIHVQGALVDVNDMKMFKSAILSISCAKLHKEIFSLRLLVWFVAGADRVLHNGKRF
jgi:hypothetical protein